ncbi:type VI secretion system Vgr family protein [Taibaiella koreensis]|uniref:type VI secretion system Vgr family protein n=1 Tax=Taibaiella koreensis TaxID=1268548 RepID=UPI000E59EF3A|nr:phage baseplate assembly protein V [Taibaiella koreensis]
MFDSLSAIASQLLPTYIGANVWIGDKQIKEILSLEIRQEHACHHLLSLRFYQDQVQQEGSMIFDGAENLLGQVVEVILFDRNATQGDRKLKNLFVATRIAFDHSAMNEGILVLEAKAPTYVLDGAPHYESFYHKNLATIAKTVCKPLEKVNSKLIAAPTLDASLSYVSRFGESAWNFMKRLSAETGQWLYFNGKELIFGQPESQQARDLIYGQNCYKLEMSMQARPVQGGYFDYNASENTPLSSAANSDTDVANSDRGFAFGKAKNIFGGDSYTHPVALPADAQTLAGIGKSRANTTAADLYLVNGESTLHELNVGMIANLQMVRAGVKLDHTPVRITAITHHLDATGSYSNSFSAISAQSVTPPPIDFLAPMATAMPAEVIDNADPMGQGRVQVKFLGWQQDHSQQQTDWIRILTPDAGSSSAVNKNRGYVFIPEKGDQVMIAFEQNNPDRPYVQGSIFHGSNGAGGFAENHLKSIITRSGCTIQLDDTDNAGSIKIQDPSGNIVFLDGKGNINITAPKNINIKAGEDINISAGRNIAMDAGKDMGVTVSDNKSVTVGKNYSHQSDNHVVSVNKDKTERIGAAFTQTSGNADIKTLKGDMLLRGSGLAVVQGGKDVKVSKG